MDKMKIQGKTIHLKRFSGVLIIFLMVTLALIPFISAVKPTQLIDSGCEIRFPQVTYLIQNEDVKIHTHVINISEGANNRLDNSTTNCYVHLYNLTSHIFEGNMSFDSNGLEWDLEILKGNFSNVGEFTYYIECASSSSICAISGGYVVSASGLEPTIPQAVMYGIILFILLVLFLGSFAWFNTIEWGHYKSDEGTIVQVNKERTKKILLFFSSYVLSLLLIFTGKSMTNNFMLLNDTFIFFDIFFDLLLVSIIPVTLAVIGLAILTTITDTKLQEALFSAWG